VLRAGEVHRQSVRTGTLAMKDLDDDVLRSILDALARGAPNEACKAATRWCALNNRHRRMCAESDGLWHELTERIFGADAETFRSGPGTGQRNFEDHCAADSAKRWLQEKGVVEDLSIRFLGLLGDTLRRINAGDKETVEGRLFLAWRMRVLLEEDYDLGDDDLRRRVDEIITGLFEVGLLYAMLETGTEEEKDAALETLQVYANNHDYDYDPPWPTPGDRRQGYEKEKIGLLKRVFVDGNVDRKLKVLGLWDRLLARLPDATAQDDIEVGSYVIQLLENDMLKLLVNTVKGTGTSSVPADAKLRESCALVLAYFSLRLYEMNRRREGH
jgi:hypothetical protein